MIPDEGIVRLLPDSIGPTLRHFERALGLRFRLLRPEGAAPAAVLYETECPSGTPEKKGGVGAVEVRFEGVVSTSEGESFILQILEVPPPLRAESVGDLVLALLADALRAERESRFFTRELSERYEEINLLYSIGETLGSVMDLGEAARLILGEVCDVVGARRGSLWVFDQRGGRLELLSQVGDPGRVGPISVDDPEAVTAKVFREGRAVMGDEDGWRGDEEGEGGGGSLLSVPVRFTPPSGEARTVGVMNLLGRRRGGRFTAGDQKLLAAIASQVGAALENRRLVRESLAQERTAKEMELAHHLQMKLLPQAETFWGAEVAARVEPAEQVGGDFYHLLRLSGNKIGVMIGDVSTHGFPAALIMALSMSAATIYALEVDRPAEVLTRLDAALREELESTEMYLSLFYGVLDPAAGEMTYSNAGHPYAFLLHPEGTADRLRATDPPVGFRGPDSYRQCTLPWRRGQDLLLLFTDGISDALAEGNRRSGEARVLEAALAVRRGPVRAIVEKLFEEARRAGSGLGGDDRTVLVLRA